MTVTERRLISASWSGVSSVNGELAQPLSSCSLGDEASFVELYDATVARLFGLVLRIMRDRAQSEEVTQEAYLHIWQNSALDPASSMAGATDRASSIGNTCGVRSNPDPLTERLKRRRHG